MIIRVEYRQALRFQVKLRTTGRNVRKCDFLFRASAGNLEQHVARSYQ